MKKLISTFTLLTLVSACGGPDNTPEDSDGVASGEHRVFITSVATTGDMAAGTGSSGMAKADKICQDRAEAANLTRDYKAIISDSTADASSRLVISGEVYTVDDNGDKYLIAEASSEFWDSDTTPLKNTIDRTESGALLANKEVWTGSLESGATTSDHCVNWTDTGSTATYGDNSIKTSAWIESSATANCNTSKHLYCISQD